LNERISSARQKAKARLKELPVWPTLLTAGNLACGCTAILCAAAHQPMLQAGAILVFAAMIFDMFDGKVARLTGTDSEFGIQLDSLADIVSFGVAPAMLVHRLVLGSTPGPVWGQGERLIWCIAVGYAVLAAIRLARYNVEAHDDYDDSHADEKSTPSKCFKGLPSPGAAGVICAWIIGYVYTFGQDAEVAPGSVHYWMRIGLMILTATCALLMVSRAPFPHLGNTLLAGRKGFRIVVLLVGLIMLGAMFPVPAVVIVTSGYLLYGLSLGLVGLVNNLRRGKSLLEEDD
jgi:CDP-diacylglycerol--serine O-phosphatidyltransferase